MKALLLDRPGLPETLRLAEVGEPHPSAGEVRVRVHAVGLNPADYKLAAGGFSRWSYPMILGLDVAGIIDKIGPDVTDWNVGDKVYYHGDLTKPGGYAEATLAAAHAIAPLPDGLSFAEAAALPCAGFTAYQALHRKLHFAPGQSILIHGGAGGVGGFAVQLASLISPKVFATSSPRNFECVRELGAAEVLDYHQHHHDLKARVRELTHGQGVDAVIDTVDSQNATASLDYVAFNGGIACINGLPDVDKAPYAISFHDAALGGAYVWGHRPSQEDLARMGRELGALVSAGKIRSMLEEVITLEEIPAALTRLSQRHVRGKIVAQLVP